MTNIVVKQKTTADPVDRREGMIEAGDKINDWVKDNEEPAAKYFFDDVFEDVTDGDNFRYFIDLGGPQRRLRPSRNPGVYRFGGGQRRRLKVRSEDDGKDSDRNQKMTIGVPRERKDLLAGGYVDTIMDDINNILYPGGPAAVAPADLDRAKKYLLASIFLNRCA